MQRKTHVEGPLVGEEIHILSEDYIAHSYPI